MNDPATPRHMESHANPLSTPETMQMILKYALMALGFAAILIGLMMFLLGPQATGNVFAGVFSRVISMPETVVGLGDVNTDSEMRFYSVLWVTYGIIAVQAAHALPKQLTRARILMFIFFMGGIARLFSIAQFGMPHPLFIALMSVELALPAIWLLFSLKRIKVRTQS